MHLADVLRSEFTRELRSNVKGLKKSSFSLSFRVSNFMAFDALFRRPISDRLEPHSKVLFSELDFPSEYFPQQGPSVSPWHQHCVGYAGNIS